MIFLILLAIQAGAQSVSYSDLPKLVAGKNENVKASKVMVDSAEARTGHLARSFIPQVTAAAGRESFSVTSQPERRESYWRVGAQMNLYRGGRDRLEDDIREKQLDVSRLESGAESAAELKKAQDAYWEIVALNQILEFRKEELKQNEENIRSASRKMGAGVATNADKLQFELNKTAIDQSVAQIELDLDYSKNKLAVALGLDEHVGFNLTEGFSSVKFDVPAVRAGAKRLRIEAMRAGEELEISRAKSYGSWWQPHLDAYASYGVPGLEDEYERAIRGDKETVAGLRLTFDLGQGLHDRSEARAKGLEAKAAGHRRNYAGRELDSQEHELEHHMRRAVEMILQTEKNLEKARSFLSLTKKEYQRGIKNGPDLLSASRQYFELHERKTLLTKQFLEHRSAFEMLNARLEAPR